MEIFQNDNTAITLTPDFEDFDFEGLVEDEFSIVESKIQKKYFYKKAEMLPEILGIDAKKFYKIRERMQEQEELYGKGNYDTVGLMDDEIEFDEYCEYMGMDENELKELNFRKKRTNQREFRYDGFGEKYSIIKEKIPQLEEDFDYTPLKEILYSFDTMKSLDNKITKLEKQTKMYDTRQPRISELQKKLNMLIDKLPGHIRKIIHNQKKDFVDQFMGKEYKTKNLRWKMIDKDVPSTVLDYTDSTPILTLDKLRMFTPTDVNVYLNEVFPWFKPGDVNFYPKTVNDFDFVDECNYYMEDELNDMYQIQHDDQVDEEEKDELDEEMDELEGDGEEKTRIKTLKRSRSDLYDETELDKSVFMLSEEQVQDFNNKNKLLKINQLGFIFNKKDNKFIGSIDVDGEYLFGNNNIFKYDKAHYDLYSQKMDKMYFDEDFEEDETYLPYDKILDEEPNILKEIEDFDDDVNLFEIDNEQNLYDDHDIPQEENDEEGNESYPDHHHEEYKKEYDELFNNIDNTSLKKGGFPYVDEYPEKTYMEDTSYNKKGFSKQDLSMDGRLLEDEKEFVDSGSLNVEDLIQGFTLGRDEQDVMDFTNIKGDFELRMDNYTRRPLNHTTDDFYNTRDNMYYLTDVQDPHFHQFQQALDLSNYRAEMKFGGIEFEKREVDGESEIIDFSENLPQMLPNFKKAQMGFKLHFMQHLKANLKSKSNTGLSKNEKLELVIFNKMEKDDYYKHYMSTNFRNFALVNSEMMLETMSETNNPDLGFLLDARLNLKKMALQGKPSKNIILDLKSKYDISDLKIEEARKEIKANRSRITSFGSGHRKRSSALAVVHYPGTGKINVNRRQLTEYFQDLACRNQLIKPITAINKLCQIDLKVYVHGGGYVGQSQACRLAVSKALKKLFPMARFKLGKLGFLRVDLRSKETKKTAMPKARKNYTYVRR